MASITSRVINELRLPFLWNTTRDVKLLLLQKFVRMAAYGAIAFILAMHMSLLGVSDQRIGVFMTLTLLGDVIISFFLTLFADGLGRKRVLILGAALMAGSGVVFGLMENFWILLLASIFGVISPSGNEIGPFQAIEDSILAQLIVKDHRSDIFAWAQVISALGMAVGQFVCGACLQYLQETAGWGETRSYKLIFFVYAALGVWKLLLATSLSEKCEAVKKAPVPAPAQPTYAGDGVELGEQQPFLSEEAVTNEDSHEQQLKPQGGRQVQEAKGSKLRAFLPQFSAESAKTVLKLSILFAGDSFATGCVSRTWVSYYFNIKFDTPLAILGTVFFVCNVISATSNLVSASIARRFGLLNTIVFTHLPSTLFLALIGVSNTFDLAVLFMVLRASTAQMQNAPKKAFLSAAVLSSERTATMGVLNVVKTLAQSGGPLVTGHLAGDNKFGLAFIIAGSLKATYDVAMLIMFFGFKGREDESEDSAVAANEPSSQPVASGSDDNRV